MKPPSPRVSAVGRAIDEILADGNWHDLPGLIEAVIHHVPPGQAHRRAEQDRRRAAVRDGREPGARVRGDDGVAVDAGARRVARDAVLKRIQRGTAERQDQRVRRRMAT